jgi:hypothetical protein
VGQIVGVHVGDDESRREYVILGDPIDQVCEAVNAASLRAGSGFAAGNDDIDEGMYFA